MPRAWYLFISTEPGGLLLRDNSFLGRSYQLPSGWADGSIFFRGQENYSEAMIVYERGSDLAARLYMPRVSGGRFRRHHLADEFMLAFSRLRLREIHLGRSRRPPRYENVTAKPPGSHSIDLTVSDDSLHDVVRRMGHLLDVDGAICPPFASLLTEGTRAALEAWILNSPNKSLRHPVRSVHWTDFNWMEVFFIYLVTVRDNGLILVDQQPFVDRIRSFPLRSSSIIPDLALLAQLLRAEPPAAGDMTDSSAQNWENKRKHAVLERIQTLGALAALSLQNVMIESTTALSFVLQIQGDPKLLHDAAKASHSGPAPVNRTKGDSVFARLTALSRTASLEPDPSTLLPELWDISLQADNELPRDEYREFDSQFNSLRARLDKCFNCGQQGHRADTCKHTESLCFSCGKAGHLSYNCPTKDSQRGLSTAKARPFARTSGDVIRMRNGVNRAAQKDNTSSGQTRFRTVSSKIDELHDLSANYDNKLAELTSDLEELGVNEGNF
jgi:hypothetical protein